MEWSYIKLIQRKNRFYFFSNNYNKSYCYKGLPELRNFRVLDKSGTKVKTREFLVTHLEVKNQQCVLGKDNRPVLAKSRHHSD